MFDYIFNLLQIIIFKMHARPKTILNLAIHPNKTSTCMSQCTKTVRFHHNRMQYFSRVLYYFLTSGF